MKTELIQRLDDQAYDDAWNGEIREDESVGQLKRERFAELIIRECINEIHGANLGDLPAASYYLDKVAEHIEKHFGLSDE